MTRTEFYQSGQPGFKAFYINTLDLMEYVMGYIDEHNISCADAIHQSDKHAENALEFMEKCCKCVGFNEEKDI